MKKPIISGSGIRGVFGSSFTIPDAVNYAAAFGRLIGPGRVVIGRDTRISGSAVETAVSAGLMAVGCSPVLLGIVPTPTVQLETMVDDVVGGIAVTSSHNPGEWNALKLIGPDGVFLRADARSKLMEILSGENRWVDYRTVGRTENLKGAIERHVNRIESLQLVKKDGRSIKAILDITGGAVIEFAPLLMHKLNVEFDVINPRILSSGDFPRVAEPVPGNLEDLSSEVVRKGADLGFAFDPDGDRLALVDDNGKPIGEDFTIALVLDYVLAKRPGNAVVNLSTSMLAEEAAQKHGSRLFRSPVGEVNVVEEMERVSSSIGGEGNGGVIDVTCHPGRDSGVAMAYIISLMRERKTTLRGCTDEFPKYFMIKRKVDFSGSFELYVNQLNRVFGKPSDIRDGLWFRRDRGWIHIRPSGTEPVVRFIAENTDCAVLEKDFKMFLKTMDN